MLEEEYPGFKKWFFDKVVPETLSGLRKIFVAYCKKAIAGIIIVKNSDEKKICTLYVVPEFRNIGVGQALIRCAIEYLQTKYPLITVSENHIHEFENIFRKFNFRLNEKRFGYYRKNCTEYVFNGSLK